MKISKCNASEQTVEPLIVWTENLGEGVFEIQKKLPEKFYPQAEPISFQLDRSISQRQIKMLETDFSSIALQRVQNLAYLSLQIPSC